MEKSYYMCTVINPLKQKRQLTDVIQKTACKRSGLNELIVCMSGFTKLQDIMTEHLEFKDSLFKGTVSPELRVSPVSSVLSRGLTCLID
jgi:hypothetical protein